MFLLTLFGKTQPYSDRRLAEKNAVNWLRKAIIDNYWVKESWVCGNKRLPTTRDMFENAFQQENYTRCVEVWNEFAITNWFGNSLYQAQIKEYKIDATFT